MHRATVSESYRIAVELQLVAAALLRSTVLACSNRMSLFKTRHAYIVLHVQHDLIKCSMKQKMQ